jgi:enoyl-CoA hydratase/carnithine racemase
MSEAFHVEALGEIQVWTFNRPHARNAIDEDMALGLEHALAAAEQATQLRAVVRTGSGESTFVSGADLQFLRDASPERRAANDTRMLELLQRLEELPVPVIGALNGAVVGGGSEIAVACDLRIAEPHVTITMKHAAMGVSPGWGGLARLSGLVGRSTAAKLLFTAVPIAAQEALRVGLIDEVVGPGHAKARSLELAQAICQTSPTTVAEMKRLLWATYRQGATLSAPDERRTFLARSVSQDHGEALVAFFEKRAAIFRPRGEG